MKVTLNTIWIGKEAYNYLRNEQRVQRGCNAQTEEQLNSFWDRRIKNSPRCKNGMFRATDDSFGGGDGTYNGKWWSWSVETLKNMLNDAGYTYVDGEPIEADRI